jgi:uncharacterized protein YkwD
MRNFLHHLLFPRESNNHRAKILHNDSLIVIICLFLFVTSLFAAVGKTSPDVLGISFNITASDLLASTNQKRQENNLGPLQMNDQLSVAAAQKAEHMFANNYWAHIAPDGTTPWFFIKNSGYEYLYAGENLARGFTTSTDVVNAWMDSPTHRENMLSKNYNEIGFAIREGSLTGSDTVLVVEMLGGKYVAQAQPQNAAQTPSPTPVVVAVISPQPASQRGEPSPTVFPTATATPTPTPQPETTTSVASMQNKPLIDGKSMTNKIALGFLAIIIAVLIVDAVIIERKQIVRVVSHNLDHIIFLIIIVLVIIIIGRGIIL